MSSTLTDPVLAFPAAALDARRRRAAEAWGADAGLVLVGSGEPIPVNGAGDQLYPFVAHAEYVYLTDDHEPGGVLAFDPASGWTHFVPAVTEAERVWEGRMDRTGTPLPELAGWLAARRGRPLVALGAGLPGVPDDPARRAEYRAKLAQVRRRKDEAELARMRAAAAATARGFEAARATIRPGVTERAVQVEIEAAFFRAGGDRTAYGTIVGAGPNAGVLHYTLCTRAIAKDDVVLIDAGAEIRRYCADVTRTYPASGSWSGFAKDLFDVVLATEREAVAASVVGARWLDVHLGACRTILGGLRELGLLNGEVDGLLAQGVNMLFFPHGVGHMVGLGVRDVGPDLPRLPADPKRPPVTLRIDLTLAPGDTVTIEPGVYFIPALIDDRERRERYRGAVNWSKVDALKGFGGIRLEDNVHVTPSGPENLTSAIPMA